VRLFQIDIQNGYVRLSGTSMAAPAVTGTVALMGSSINGATASSAIAINGEN
jgi:subtilisin family serine protease